MRAVRVFLVMELRLYWREPAAVFFTYAFPILLLFLFGGINGNEPQETLGGYGVVDLLVPGYMALVIATIGIPGLTATIASYRESGYLRRLEATPLGPQRLLLGTIAAEVVKAIPSFIVLVVVAKLVFGLRFDGNPVLVAVALLASTVSFTAVGFTLASLVKSTRTATAVSQFVFFPMIFLSGATIPRDQFPDAMQTFSQILPLTHVVTLIRGLWIGQAVSGLWVPVAVLAALAALGLAVSGRFFRWA
jgi:ABC-2 type transport system permease protein